MLVLSRKQGQRIQIGDSITVTVLAVRGGTVRLGFAAPVGVPIHREEVWRQINENVSPAQPNPAPVRLESQDTCVQGMPNRSM